MPQGKLCGDSAPRLDDWLESWRSMLSEKELIEIKSKKGDKK